MDELRSTTWRRKLGHVIHGEREDELQSNWAEVHHGLGPRSTAKRNCERKEDEIVRCGVRSQREMDELQSTTWRRKLGHVIHGEREDKLQSNWAEVHHGLGPRSTAKRNCEIKEDEIGLFPYLKPATEMSALLCSKQSTEKLRSESTVFFH
ncbi:hypothetical protein YC2023_007421 [Brassica napus]